MLFNSIEYAIFLPIVFALYWLLPNKHKWVVLFAASYYFYMSWNVKYVLLILFTTAVSFFTAQLIEKTESRKKKKFLITTTLVSSLGVLFVFKYYDFFISSFTDLLARISINTNVKLLELLLPVGISFYTFQTLSYVIDVYRGNSKAEKHFGIFATFIAFFPQLVAGPIERTNNLLPQLKKEHKFSYKQASYGVKLIVWGLIKKMVIADNLAIYVDRIYNNLLYHEGFSLLIATVFFSIQIYCDFSGYSDIARGSAKLFGIELMENFKTPYLSSTVKEFWSRWHISLSTWFRDYVYVPLGGNRVSKIRHQCNLIITFLVSGLWHGANWTFVIWGMIHGIAQVLENILHIKSEKKGKFNRFVSTIFVVIFVCFAWIFFRAQNFSEAIYVITNMFAGISQPIKYISDGILETGMTNLRFTVCIFVYILPLAIYDYFAMKTDVIEWISKRHVVVRHLIYSIMVIAVIFLHAIGEVSFVYFQF